MATNSSLMLRLLGGVGGQSRRHLRIVLGGVIFGAFGVLGIVVALLLLDRGNESVLGARASEFAAAGAGLAASEPLALPPDLVDIQPPPGASLQDFDRVRLTFSRPLAAIESLELRANGETPIAIEGAGRGPYQFRFPKSRGSLLKLELSGDVSAAAGGVDSTRSINRTWEYPASQSIEAVISSVSYRDQSLSAGEAKIVSSGEWWISIENKGQIKMNTLGWRLVGDHSMSPMFVLPQRVIDPGEISEFPLLGLQEGKNFDAEEPFGSGGVISLYDAGLAARLLDVRSFERSPGSSREIRLRRIEAGLEESAGSRAKIGSRRMPWVPVPDLPSGNYPSPIQIKLVAFGDSEEIWFTRDGSIPTKENGERYHEPVTVSESMVIRAVAYVGSDRSRVGTYSYTLGDEVSHPHLPILELVTFSKEKTGQLTMSATMAEGEVKGTVLFWRRSEGGRKEFEGELRPVRSLGKSSKRDAASFSVRVSRSNVPDVEKLDSAEGPFSSGKWFDCRPAFDSAGIEMVDTLVQELSDFSEQRPTEVRFVNLVENGENRGLYRLTPAREEPRLSAFENGPPLIVSGASAEWEQLFSELLKLNLAKDESYSKICEQFDVPAFCRYYLTGMFWGDPVWPGRGESVFRDESSGAWNFKLTDLLQAGSLWGESERFSAVTERVSATGAVFEALWRSSAFRDVFADQAASLFGLGNPIFLDQIADVRLRLETELGSRVRRRLERFAPSAVENRRRQMWAYLDRLGIVRRIDGEIDVNGAQRYVVDSAEDGKPVKSNLNSLSRETDLWLIDSESRMRVWIPTSDRAADWNQLAFDDSSWPESMGRFGFDSKGFSGALFDSGFRELVFNRSTGAYFRVPFELKLGDLETFESLVLRCQINDGFVAYLNGVEIQRFNVPEALPWNSIAAGDVRGTGWRFREFDVSASRQLLKPGKNLLAVHAVNSMINGPSFFLNVELRGVKQSMPPRRNLVDDDWSPPAGEDHVFRLNRDGQWSTARVRFSGGLGQYGDVQVGRVYLRNERGESFEFLALHCQSGEPVRIRSIGVGQSCARLESHRWLQPGKIAYLVNEEDTREFRDRWPGRRLLGSFSGDLVSADDIVVWGEGSVLDQVPLMLGSAAYVPGEMLGFERDRSSGFEGRWRRLKPVESPVVRENQVDASIRMERVQILERAGTSRVSVEVVGKRAISEQSIWLEAHWNDDRLQPKIQRQSVGAGQSSAVSVDLGRRDELVGPLQLVLWDGRGNRLDEICLGNPGFPGEIRRFGEEGAWRFESTFVDREAGQIAPGLVVVNELVLQRKPVLGALVEFFNPSHSRDVDISRFELSIGDYACLLPDLGLVPPRGYFVVNVPGSLVAQLTRRDSSRSWAVRLKDGERLVDEFLMPPYDRGSRVSFGRWPDVEGQVLRFGEKATLGGPNILVRPNLAESSITLSEVTAFNEESFGDAGDWFELHNVTERLIDLSGMSVSIGRPLPGQWEFPEGSRLYPEGFLFLRADASSPSSKEAGTRMNIGRSLRNLGDAIYLFDRDSRQIDAIEFGPQLRDRSLVRTSPATWSLSARPSPGGRNRSPARINQFPILTVASGGVREGENSFLFRLRNETSEPVRVDAWRLIGLADGVVAGEYRLPSWSILDSGQALEIDLEVEATMIDYLNECQLRNPQGRLVARIPIKKAFSQGNNIR
jgi:hypothetical protein